jgi:metal-sulfur cluster biosynthetic enzyme
MSVVLPIAHARKRDTGLPMYVTSHMSGGRDLWSEPLADEPDDPTAAAWEVLDEVLDPELPISLVALGLIYGVEVRDRVAAVRLTYTATACPCMEFIREDVTDRLERETWVDRVEIVEVWDPPWTTERISQEGRERLRRLGVGA